MRGTAVVTGASSGIGAEIARLLSRTGYRCILIARREDRLRALAEELDGEYEICDVTDRAAVESTAARILERHPALAVLVNNAGVPTRASFLDGDPVPALETNYLGSVWCLRAFLPGLEAGAPSHVVNIVSVAGTATLPRAGPYSARRTPMRTIGFVGSKRGMTTQQRARLESVLRQLVRQGPLIAHVGDSRVYRIRQERIAVRPRSGVNVELSDLLGPEVLVLDVDQRARLPQGLAVEARDAPLAGRRERERRPLRGIGAKDLDRRATGRSRWHAGLRRDEQAARTGLEDCHGHDIADAETDGPGFAVDEPAGPPPATTTSKS